MIGILVVTHADLGQGLLNAVALIAGDQPVSRAVGLFHGDSPDELESKILAALDDLDQGDGVLVFTDFYGGTPSNTVMRCMSKRDFRCLTGANMPMLLEALTSRDTKLTIEELEENCIAIASESVIKLEDRYLESLTSVQEEDDEDF